MKSVLIATTCTLFAASLLAQTATTAGATAASTGNAQNMSTEEKNTEAYIELLRKDLRKSKSQVMGDVMELDADESSKFWPIYKEFEAELTKLGDQVLTAATKYVDNYDKMTDPLADELASKVLTIEQQRNALKKKYYDRFKKSMGAVTAMRFLQVENQLERLMDLQVASSLPVEHR